MKMTADAWNAEAAKSEEAGEAAAPKGRFGCGAQAWGPHSPNDATSFTG